MQGAQNDQKLNRVKNRICLQVHLLVKIINGPRREKSCLRGFHQSEFQTSLLSYRDYLENWNSICSKFTYDSFQKANNKGADQTVRMRRLVCACVVRKPPKTGFLATRHILSQCKLSAFYQQCV